MKFESVATLRKMLATMEQDLGLGDLNEAQRDVLYAVQLLDAETDTITAKQLHSHELTKSLPRATFFRALRSLIDLGYLRQRGKRNEGYELTNAK